MKVILSSNPYRDKGLKTALEARRIRAKESSVMPSRIGISCSRRRAA